VLSRSLRPSLIVAHKQSVFEIGESIMSLSDSLFHLSRLLNVESKTKVPIQARFVRELNVGKFFQF